jgi:hypothetical protein
VRNDALLGRRTSALYPCPRAQPRCAAAPARPNGVPLFNTILSIVDKESELPDWLTLRHIPISPPDRGVCRALAPHGTADRLRPEIVADCGATIKVRSLPIQIAALQADINPK